MRYTVGQAKPAGSGRKRGQGWKAMKRTVSELCAAAGVDPILEMVGLASDENTATVVRARLWCELAGYIHPKRKAIEVSGAPEVGVEINVPVRERILAKLQQLADRRLALVEPNQ